MPSSKRTRSLTLRIPRAGMFRTPSGTILGDQFPYERTGSQITESIGHKRAKNGKFYEGGPFYTAKLEIKTPTIPATLYQNPAGITKQEKGNVYRGPIYTWIPLAEVTTDLDSFKKSRLKPDYSGLDTYGAEAIDLCKPTNPNADFGIALGEIVKDGGLPIPLIQTWRQQALTAKAAGSEYLNAVFGWLPLISDIEDTAKSIKDYNTILDNYHRSSGSNVRREFSFDTEREESTAIVGSANESVAGGPEGSGALTKQINRPGGQQGTMTRTTTKEVRRWFSGCFTHQSAGDNDTVQNMLGVNTDAEKLLGVSLTPDLLWELTPWSWAVDWFSNAGNVISNVGAFVQAGLVMRYGYIMEETIIKKTYTLSNAGFKSYNGPVPPAEMTLTVKRRTEANPFGFGLTWDGLSPTQMLITAALGITRLR